MWNFCRSRRAALGLSLLFLSCTAASQDESSGTIVGRVTDASGESRFQGAAVSIDELGRLAVSGRDGRFRFSNVPTGSYTLTVEYVGADPEVRTVQLAMAETAAVEVHIGDASARLDNVLVVGQAAGQAAALNQQRVADNLVTIASADAIGQFPDQNVAEALQRLPGISLSRDQGEGRFAIIRGIDPALNSTTINGIRVPGPEDDSRQVNLDVISSDLLETIIVTKTVTPDMDGDAIGGNIELQSATAFDRGNSASLRAESSYNDLYEDASPKLAGTFTRLFSVGEGYDTLGVAFSASWFERDFGSDNIETAGFPLLEGADGMELRGLEEGEQRDYTITRERLSASLNFDFQPTPASEYYLHTLFSEFRDDEVQLSNVFKFEDGDIVALTPVSGRFSGGTVEKLTEAREETQDIFSIVAGGENLIDRWTLDYSLGHSYANEDEPRALSALWLGEGIDLGYDLDDAETPKLFGEGAAYADPAGYALDEVAEGSNFTEERETSLSFNLQRDMSFGANPGYIKFGAQARLREKEADLNTIVFSDFGGDFTLADFDPIMPDYPLGPYGPAADAGSFADFYARSSGSFEVDLEETAIENQGGDYDLDEDIYAAYLMGRVDVDNLRIVGGVRVEDTRYDAIGTRIVIDEAGGSGEPMFEPVRARKDYTNVLPNLNLRYGLGNRTVLRGAYTKTLARPGFGAAAPRQLIEIEEDDGGEVERNAEIGNPDLDPFESQNLDLAFEHYPGDFSALTAGVFYKDISDFVVITDVAGMAPFEDFDEVIQAVNGDDAELWGIELGLTHRFGGLPAPWDGLLVNANYTHTESDAELPFRDSSIPLPRQSDDIGNFSVGYEKYGLSLRLAATYRSEFFDEAADMEDPAFDRYVDEHLQVDLTAKYRVRDYLQVYLNLVNITDEPLYAYFDDERFASQYEEYGYSAELGLRVDF